MASQEELIVKIGADLDEMKREMKTAGKLLGKMGDESKKTGKTMSVSFAKATVAVTGLAVALKTTTSTLKAVTLDVVENAREQAFWANRLEVSKESFSSLVAVGMRFGAEMDDVGDAIKDVNERIADAARGNKTYEEALRMIGLRSRDLINLPVEDQFLKVADAIGKMSNAGDQNFATAELMADAGFRLLEMFRLGAEGIEEMRTELETTNVALSKMDFETLERLNKDILMAKENAVGLGNRLAVLAAGPISALAEKTKEWSNALVEGVLGTETAKKLQAYNTMVEAASEIANKATDKLIENEKEVQLAEVTIQGERVSMLEQFLEQQSEVRRAAREAQIMDEQMFNDQLYATERAHAERMSMLWNSGLKGRMEVAKGFFGSMSVLMQTENRKMFEIGKAAAIANATISTIESAQKAFNSLAGIPVIGPALGGAAAAAAIAAGVARVQQISSTTMGGGGGGAGAVSASASPETGAVAAPENVIDATFNLQTEQGFVSTDQIRGVASGLNEFIEDGGRIRSVSVI